MAADEVKFKNAETAQGDTVKIMAKRDDVFVINARVIKTDIVCSNGVIHVIDAVLMPPAKEKPSSFDRAAGGFGRKSLPRMHRPVSRAISYSIRVISPTNGDSSSSIDFGFCGALIPKSAHIFCTPGV